MAVYVEIGERVLNKKNESGVIESFDGKCIIVAFCDRKVQFNFDAFDLGFLKLENINLQNKIDMGETVVISHNNDKEEKIKVRFEYAPIRFGNFDDKMKKKIQRIFDACDDDMSFLKSFNPVMNYPKLTSRSTSKYCAGFLYKHLDTYVLRVFSRMDVYKNRVKTGVAILESDTTEIFRVLYIDDKIYYFCKNINPAGGHFNNTNRKNCWETTYTYPANQILLNEVQNKSYCIFLNEYITENNIYLAEYANLLFPALVDNKVEIVFKNKLYASTYHINDIKEYLSQYTHKQIDFASKNNILNTLPVIKSFGLYDLDILNNVELIRRKKYGNSVYSSLEKILKNLNLECSNLDKKVIDFIKKIENFDVGVYSDYINLLSRQAGVTLKDFFDKDYVNRHDVLVFEMNSNCSYQTAKQYEKEAKNLIWIDRKVDEYYIIVPKSIDDFKYEGQFQHNCVYVNAYYEDVIDQRSIIVFLRKEPNMPFVTIEYDYQTFYVNQARGKYNSKLDEDLQQFVVELGKQLRYERTNRC